MTPQETIAVNILLHQLAFLRRSLGIGRDDEATSPAPSSNVPDEAT